MINSPDNAINDQANAMNSQNVHEILSPKQGLPSLSFVCMFLWVRACRMSQDDTLALQTFIQKHLHKIMPMQQNRTTGLISLTLLDQILILDALESCSVPSR